MSDTLYPPASLLKRLAALVYDSLIVMALAMAYGAIYIGVKYSLLPIELAPGEKAQMEPEGFIGLILVVEIFYWFFWCRGGQTLGMRAWRIKLVNETSSRGIPLPQALIRGMVAPISLAAGGLGYWMALLDKNKRSLHDIASQTRVVQLPKQR